MAVMEKFKAVIVVLSCVLLVLIDADDVFLTKEEELQLDNQYRLLNKPALKTIRMRNGDLYGCVDFYKQPAFDHPSLKNHTFHPQRMRPTIKSRPQQQIEPMRVDCPVGTVPIRRITKDALRRAKLHEKRYKSKQRILTVENPGFHYAVVRTRTDPNKKYSAAGAVITVYNISVGPDQFSLSRMQLQRGPDSIQVGFMVNPDLYNGALDTRVFIYTKSTQIECFNLMCPGFIHVNHKIPLDATVYPISRKGGPTCTITFFIHRLPYNGDWWLELGSTREQIGYWPASIFGGGGLEDLATSIDWGGEVFSPLGVSSPPMGASDKIVGHARPKFDAFCARLITADETLAEVDAVDTETYSDLGKFYQVLDKGFLNEEFKHLMFFGGPGGAIGN